MKRNFENSAGKRSWLAAFNLLVLAASAAAAASQPAAVWWLPPAREVQLRGPLGEAYDRGVRRLGLPPYDSPAYLRSDFSFETNRIFVNYSGDISGRFIQIASLVSPPGTMTPATLAEVLRDFSKYQKADGHFGREVDWSQPLEPENSHAVLLPIFWGNSRLLVGLLEAWRAFGREDCLAAARRLGDFYIATAGRFLDPAREAEYRMTGTYAAGYPTDYFPGIEGLALLYQATRDERYLQQAERMARFFERFDTLPIDHSHGNLITHYGLLLLHEATGKQEYLDRPLARWQQAVAGGYVWPMGGVGEKFRVSHGTDEGCSEADWLRLNLRLWELTSETRFLELAERLLCNHYAMNRAANGGYGHHEFAGDAEGPLRLRPQFTEAVWCCTFHGLLGLHTLKRHIVAGSPRGVFVNFPMDAVAAVPTSGGLWQVAITTAESGPGRMQCRIRIDPLHSHRPAIPPEIWVRRPAWAGLAERVDNQGNKAPVLLENGYYRFHQRPGTEGRTTLVFSSPLRVEDRRLRPVALPAGEISRRAGVTLFAGPHMLLSTGDQSRPVLVAQVDQHGHLVPPAGLRFPCVDRLEATEEQLRQALNSPARLPLTPWETTSRETSAAFVFDLITLPATGVEATKTAPEH